MFSKTLIFTLILISLVGFMSLQTVSVVKADSMIDNLKKAATGAQYNPSAEDENTIPNMIGQIVAIVLSFVGSIFLILIIFSGLQWMTAGGNEEKVKDARTRLMNSGMGLAITIAAYFITWLISSTLLS